MVFINGRTVQSGSLFHSSQLAMYSDGAYSDDDSPNQLDLNNPKTERL